MRTLPRLLTMWLIARALLGCDGGEAGDTETDAAGQSESDAGGTRDAGAGDAANGMDARTNGDGAAKADAKAAEDARSPGDGSSANDAAQPPDAGGRDAAGGRSFSTDRAAFFGTPRCTSDSFLLCEDFESEAAGAAADPSVWETLGERISVDGTRAARGERALHVVTRSLESTHFIRTTKVAPTTKLWGRLFFWSEPPRPGAFSHWTVIEGTGTHPAGGTARVRFGGIYVPNVENRLQFNYDIWGGRPGGFHEVGRELNGKDTADGTWHCLEWLFDVSAREARLFRDGSEEAGLHATASIDGIALDFPTLDGLNIGMATYQDLGSTTWNVWIDEVAVDSQRIGCSN